MTIKQLGHAVAGSPAALMSGPVFGCSQNGTCVRRLKKPRRARRWSLAFTDHDHRDIRADVDAVRAMLVSVSADFPGMCFRFCEAVEAMRDALSLPYEPPCDLDLCLSAPADGGHLLEVRTETPTFGPQPWLALKTLAGRYHYDNFDIEAPFHRWQYVFDEDTFPLRALRGCGGSGDECLRDHHGLPS